MTEDFFEIHEEDMLLDDEIERDGRGTIRLSRRNQRIAVEHNLTAINNTYNHIVSQLDSPEAPDLPISNSNKKAKVIALSDLHFGEEVVFADVYRKGIISKPKFNFDIAKKRITAVFNAALNSIYDNGKDTYDELVIAMAGDNVDGRNVFPHQILESEAALGEQTNQVAFSIFRNIANAHKILGKDYRIRVAGCIGNHGTTKGLNISHPVTDNADTGVYRLIESLLGLDLLEDKRLIGNVEVMYNEHQWYQGIEVKGHKILLNHILPKNLMTPASKERVHNLTRITGCDLILTGHYHERGWHKVGDTEVIRIGCLPGANNFSHQCAFYPNGAEQAMFDVTTSNVVNNFSPIFLEHI